MNIEDVGTRYTHLSELLDLWKSGFEILTKQKEDYINTHAYFSNVKEMELKDLESAIRMLEKQLDVLTHYDEERYKVRQIVDAIEMEPKDLDGIS
jgi:hypothetical protein